MAINLSVRRMTPEDVDFALALTWEEGWYYTKGELERMLKLDPDGSFIYEEKEPLGFVTTVTYGRTGVLGHLVVSKKGRGRSIGRALLEKAIYYMESRDVDAMLLYATQEGRGLYERYGFSVREEVSCIHSSIRPYRSAAHASLCKPICEDDLPHITSIDRIHFGDDRTRLLDLILREFPEYSFKLERAGRIEGFIFGRRTDTGFDLGPWVCQSGDVKDAEALFSTVLTAFESGTVYMGIFVKNADALELAHSLPPVRSWVTHLMIRGEPRYSFGLARVFGLAAFELG